MQSVQGYNLGILDPYSPPSLNPSKSFCQNSAYSKQPKSYAVQQFDNFPTRLRICFFFVPKHSCSRSHSIANPATKPPATTPTTADPFPTAAAPVLCAGAEAEAEADEERAAEVVRLDATDEEAEPEAECDCDCEAV